MNWLHLFANTEKNELGFRTLPNDKHQGRRMKEAGSPQWDKILTETALAHIPPYGVAFDCGATYGSFAEAFRSKTMLYGLVVAIEPGTLAFDCLNCNLFGFLGRVLAINAALSESHGGYLRHKVTDNEGSSLVTEWDHTGDNVLRMSIDGIVKSECLDRVDFIKMKCQGWERRILLGAKETIENLNPTLMIEINHEELKIHENTFDQIKEFLDFYGYGWEIIQKDLTETSPQFDILASIFHRKIDLKSLMNKLQIT